MSLFNPNSTNGQMSTELLGYEIQTSVYGRPITIVFGTNRVSGNVIWFGDWVASAIKSGGKFGSGKGSTGSKGGGQQYDYKSAIAIGLCSGPIAGLGNIWVNKTLLTNNQSSESYTVPPGGGTHNPIFHTQYTADLGVASNDSYSVTANDYGSPGPVTLVGMQKTPLTRVTSSPGANEYSVNVTTGAYTFGAAMAGQTVVISYVWSDPNASNDGNPVGTLNFTLFNGAQSQSPWSYLTSNHQSQALGYSGLAYVANSLLDLGSSGTVSDYGFEVFGLLIQGGGIKDCNIADVIELFLTAPLWGCLYPAFALDDLTEMWSYCQALGLFVSPVIDSQKSASSWLDDFNQGCNCEAVYSEGRLKFRSYGDKTVVGNGAIFTPNTTPVYDLDEDDFLCGVGEEPIFIDRPSVREAYNSITVEWCNRGNSYNEEPVEEKDDWAIDNYGYRPAPMVELHAITTQEVAQLAASSLLQRALYVRNKQKFKLSAIKYMLLEPMDLVTVSNQYQGMLKTPVRIKSIQEDDNYELSIESEEFPWGTATPTANPKQTVGPFGPGYYADPGFTNTPIFFEATAQMTQNIQFELLMGLSGGQNWGGCKVYMSTDGGTSYDFLGTQTGPSKMGMLTAGLALVADPDNASTLAVDVSESYSELDSFTSTQKDAFVPLVVVDQELLSYQTATLTSAYNYNLTHLRRGVFNTAIAAHTTGGVFAFIDSQMFSWIYDQVNIGQTVHFKFASFNLAGQQIQDLANVTDYPYTVIGPSPIVGTPAPNVGAIAIDSIDFSSATLDGSNHWGFHFHIASPSPDWSLTGSMLVQIEGPLVSGSGPVRDLYITQSIPTGTGTYSAVIDTTFDRPVFGQSEDYKLVVTSYNAAGSPTPSPATSSNFTVVGGGTDTPAPNFVSVTVTGVAYSGNQWSPTFSAVLPTGSQFIEAFDMRIIGPLGPDSQNGDIGTDYYFDLPLTGPFIFTSGPYPMPVDGPQSFQIEFVVYSGKGAATASPTISSILIITPGTGSIVTGVISPAVQLSSPTMDGSNHWGFQPIVIGHPTGGWPTIVKSVLVQIWGGNPVTGPTSTTPFRTAFITSAIPTGITDLWGYTDLTFDRGVFGDDEWYEVSATCLDATNNPLGPAVFSSPQKVTGGGTATPAPNAVAISNAIQYQGNNFYVVSTFTLASNFVFIERMDMRIRAYTGGVPVANSDIGSLWYFDISSTTVHYRHGPYARPPIGTSQNYDVGAVMYSGVGVATASPFFCTPFSVAGLAGAGITGSDGLATYCTGPGVGSIPTYARVGTARHNIDGGELADILVSFTMPASGDVDSVQLVWIDLADTSMNQHQEGLWKSVSYLPGTALTQKFEVPVTITSIRCVLFSFSASGAIITSKFGDVGIISIAAGMINAARLDVSKLSPRLTTVSGQLDIGANTITFGFVQSIDPSVIGLNGGHWTAPQILTVNASAILVGTLVAGLGIITPAISGGTMVGTSITVASSTGAGYTLDFDPVTGLTIVSSVNQTTLSMNSGRVDITGAVASILKQFTNAHMDSNEVGCTYGGTGGPYAFLASANNGSALMQLVGPSSLLLQIKLVGTTFGITANGLGTFLQFTGSGSFIDVFSSYKINGGTVIDSSKRLHMASNGPIALPGGGMSTDSFLIVVGGVTLAAPVI